MNNGYYADTGKLDLEHKATNRVLALVWLERDRQRELIKAGKIKFPCEHPMVIPEQKLAVLAEEFGEVARAVLEQDKAGLKCELVQVAAVATAWAESL